MAWVAAFAGQCWVFLCHPKAVQCLMIDSRHQQGLLVNCVMFEMVSEYDALGGFSRWSLGAPEA